RMLYDALMARAREHFTARRTAVAALEKPEDVRARQRELQARFLNSLGVLPERSPLNPTVLGRAERDGYRFEKVVFESRPGHHVAASLSPPAKAPPYPGVLFPCGHLQTAKAAEAYQRGCILLARNGLAVLCYDPIGQGERVQLLDSAGKPVIAGST